jgi:APA family basic amino acid/polyamine antiporter
MIMISTFACNNGLIMTGARVYYTMAQDGVFFKKAAELNKLVFLNGLSGHSVLGFGFMSYGKYGDLLDFVVIIVLIFYILTILGYLFFVKNAARCRKTI